MNTEQQLIERADKALDKKCYGDIWLVESQWKLIIDAMIDFHKQELQRIGEVVYVPVSVNTTEGLVDGERYPVISVRADKVTWFEMAILRDGEFKTYNGLSGYYEHDKSVTHWLKKLSLSNVGENSEITSTKQ